MTHATTGFSTIDFALGVVTTVVGCVAAVALPEEPNGWVALIVATTGMITALGAVTTSLVRIWAEHRRNDREELWRRHELNTKLNDAKLTIESNRLRLEEVEATVKRLQKDPSRDSREPSAQ
ncbi:MAG: hypothetical protein P4L84_37285 [Isosphaeraceae bacterium]|nr:hypothetical protein [Isosphaeraceae bacterium]